jgi:tRNA-Thr(GGU) m(6)t(6)A37 methyltransferase TsaA
MSAVSVRYLVTDVDAAIDFYTTHLGFTVRMHPNDAFAMLTRDDLRLVLVVPVGPGGPGGGGAAMPDGTRQQPGGWNRFSIEVDDLDATVDRMREHGVRFRNEIVTGVGGKQIIIDDPSGNPVELFEPLLDEARMAKQNTGRGETYEVRPVGWVESSLADISQAPNQGAQGAPDAWLVINPDLRVAIRDLRVGSDVFVLTWLHRSSRDELATRPGDNPNGPELGVFSTRSPARPNPIGLHRVTVLAVDDLRVHVSPLEAVNGTPVADIKPVIRSDEG